MTSRSAHIQFTTAIERVPTIPGMSHWPMDGSASQHEVLGTLNDAMANAIVCLLRYRSHHFLARSARSYAAAWDFLDHSNNQQGHADLIAEQIVLLGGQPDFTPDKLLQQCRAEHTNDPTVTDMLSENLIAAHLLVDDYRQFIVFLRDAYPTTRRMLESILEVEQAHVVELAQLLQVESACAWPPRRGHESH
ncbi:ferritin-like domain-containing protein [Rhodoferax antarcticus]|uniref:ferritin-like domain-containing protein n=1 Tax=Rhodoferax antarcticus TaxID=81479 RepID=UPI002224B4F3|nr:ferritin-like domain-containing protein [Rhodoferax antarcticus]MCW2313023.1 bacterioferritin [Rhodoferax antarcticus]